MLTGSHHQCQLIAWSEPPAVGALAAPSPGTCSPASEAARFAGSVVKLFSAWFQEMRPSANSCSTRSPSVVRSPTGAQRSRSEEHTAELQSRGHLVCRPVLAENTYPAFRSRLAPGA